MVDNHVIHRYRRTSQKTDAYQKWQNDKSKTFIIEQVNEHTHPERIALTGIRKLAFRLTTVLFALQIPFMAWYYRTSISAVNDTSKNLSPPWILPGTRLTPWLYATIFISIMSVTEAVFQSLVYSGSLYRKIRSRYRLKGPVVPRVDVIITVCNEPIDVAKDTILAALDIDWPSDFLRVVVSDDGNSTELEEWVSNLANKNLWYTSRPREKRSGFKAGNLNHAIEFFACLPGDEGPAPYIAGLDTDMIPERHWLRASVPHLLLDDDVGCACPCQLFYNFPRNDPLFQTTIMEAFIVDYLRDLADAAWNTGSGWVIRREALLAIGGFPTDNLCEDIYSALLMERLGWKGVAVPDTLQYGLVPDTFLGHLKQWNRWHIGGCQFVIATRLFLNKKFYGRMSIRSRWFWTSMVWPYITRPFLEMVLLIVTPLWLLFTNLPLVVANNTQELRLLLQIYSVINFLMILQEMNQAIITGYHASIRAGAGVRWLAPYFCMSTLRCFVLPSWLGGSDMPFIATGSIKNALHEREPRRRARLWRRLKVILVDFKAWPCALVVIVTISAVVRRTNLIITLEDNIDVRTRCLMWLINVGWPAPQWYLLTAACLIPIQYAIWPPSVPSRRSYLTQDPKTGVYRPSQISKHRALTLDMSDTLRYPQFYVLGVVYRLALGFLSFYL